MSETNAGRPDPKDDPDDDRLDPETRDDDSDGDSDGDSEDSPLDPGADDEVASPAGAADSMSIGSPDENKDITQ